MTRLDIPLYKFEHPDFGELEFPIPFGFVDCSWHNDTCPSWFDEQSCLKLWIDYADPVMRDSPGPRFALQQYNSEHEFVDEILTSDDYDEILRMVSTKRGA